MATTSRREALQWVGGAVAGNMRCIPRSIHVIAAFALVGCDVIPTQGTPGAETSLLDNPSSCRSTEHDRFDFLVGAWSVANQSQEPFAEFEVKESADNCTIYGFGKYTDGDTRTFFGFYDPGARRWKQAWISGGFILDVQAASNAQTRELAGTLYLPSFSREPMSARLTHELQADGTIREYLPVSADGGTRWSEGGPVVWSRKTPAD